ncbi:MAG: hypothetical protein AcusKO_06920 [Acuticoccus sp.]
MLALEGTRLSSITIQKILNENGLGTRVDRWLALEKTNAEKVVEITPEQAAFLEKLNPCFRERHVESGAPGELLSADTFFVGNLKGIGKVYLNRPGFTGGHLDQVMPPAYARRAWRSSAPRLRPGECCR